MNARRGTVIEPVAAHVPVAGLYSSALVRSAGGSLAARTRHLQSALGRLAAASRRARLWPPTWGLLPSTSAWRGRRDRQAACQIRHPQSSRRLPPEPCRSEGPPTPARVAGSTWILPRSRSRSWSRTSPHLPSNYRPGACRHPRPEPGHLAAGPRWRPTASHASTRWHSRHPVADVRRRPASSPSSLNGGKRGDAKRRIPAAR